MLLQAIHVSEVNNLVEDSPCRSRDGRFAHAAILQRRPHLFWAHLQKSVVAECFLIRLFRNVPSQSFSVCIQSPRVRRQRELLEVKEGRSRENAARSQFTWHLHVQASIDEVYGVRRAPIRGDESLESNLIAKDRGQGAFVSASEIAVHAVVRAHDG